MWELYDRLIGTVPSELYIKELIIGPQWVMLVNSAGGIGLAMNLGMAWENEKLLPGDYVGKKLIDAAKKLKSWNMAEASIGTAAVNSYFNTQSRAKKITTHINPRIENDQKEDAFLAYQQLVKGKKVGIVGHFAYIEKRFGGIAEMYILERNPQPGDYPDSACEYLLPQMDFVFITGCTLTNKTLPRLLELSKNAHVVLVGPSVPLSETLLEFGAADLSGFIPTELELCREATLNDRSLFCSGIMARVLWRNQ